MSWLEGERWGERRVVYVCDQLAVFTVLISWSGVWQPAAPPGEAGWLQAQPGLVLVRSPGQARPGQSGLRCNSGLPTAASFLSGGIISACSSQAKLTASSSSNFFPLLARQSRAERLGYVWLAHLTVFPLLKSLQARRWGEVETVGLCWESRAARPTNGGSELVWQLLVTATFPGVGWDRVSFLYYAALWGLETVIFISAPVLAQHQLGNHRR